MRRRILPEQPHRAASVLRCQHAKPLPHPCLDRIDQAVRPFEPDQHVLVEPAKPPQLQEFRPRQLEDEGGDAHAHHLGKTERSHGAEPEAARQQPQADQLDRKQQHDRNQKHQQRRQRRQPLDAGRDARLERIPGNPGDEPGDDRLQPLPQPRLEQEDEREQDPQRAKQAAHGAILPPASACFSSRLAESISYSATVHSRTCRRPPQEQPRINQC